MEDVFPFYPGDRLQFPSMMRCYLRVTPVRIGIILLIRAPIFQHNNGGVYQRLTTSKWVYQFSLRPFLRGLRLPPYQKKKKRSEIACHTLSRPVPHSPRGPTPRPTTLFHIYTRRRNAAAFVRLATCVQIWGSVHPSAPTNRGGRCQRLGGGIRKRPLRFTII